MRAVGSDPTASVVTTAAGPGGAIVPVVVQNGREGRAQRGWVSSCGAPRSGPVSQITDG